MKTRDLSLDILLLPYKNGVKLYKPEDIPKSKDDTKTALHSLSQILDIPCCVALLNSDSAVQYINQLGIEACCYLSFQDSLDKSMEDIADKDTAYRVIKNQQNVIKSKQKKFNQEDIFLKNGNYFQTLEFLLPCYKESTVDGVIAFNVVIDQHPLPEVLSRLMQVNYFYPAEQEDTSYKEFSNPLFQNIYLSSREKQCLYYCVKGKTSKEIAKILNLSYRTVEHYLDNLKNKIGVATKSELLSLILD